MSSICGDCFIVLAPHSENDSVILGRNCLTVENAGGEVQEVEYIPEKCDGDDSANALILHKRGKVWGGESGANNKNVCISIAWCDAENSVKSTDFLRTTLEKSSSALEAVDIVGTLVTEKADDNSKYSFVICDSNEVWLISTGGKVWAAEQITTGYRRIPINGLAVTTKIDKCSENLQEELKKLELWDGSGDLDFAKSFSASPTNEAWPGLELAGDGAFGLTNMFEILRSSTSDTTGSSHVSTLVSSGISCHWFTATPNPRESVFKPFVFAPNAKISPLTIIPDGEDFTLLHKLHGQRNWENVGNLLKSLEVTCVDEVKKFLNEHPTPNEELDELMKDCVEAEVKFYR